MKSLFTCFFISDEKIWFTTKLSWMNQNLITQRTFNIHCCRRRTRLTALREHYVRTNQGTMQSSSRPKDMLNCFVPFSVTGQLSLNIPELLYIIQRVCPRLVCKERARVSQPHLVLHHCRFQVRTVSSIAASNGLLSVWRPTLLGISRPVGFSRCYDTDLPWRMYVLKSSQCSGLEVSLPIFRWALPTKIAVEIYSARHDLNPIDSPPATWWMSISMESPAATILCFIPSIDRSLAMISSSSNFIGGVLFRFLDHLCRVRSCAAPSS